MSGTDRPGPDTGVVRLHLLPGFDAVAAAGEEAAGARARGHAVGVVRAMASRRRFLVAVAGALDFPAWYGHNLDALADCLRDLSWLPEGPVTLVWTEPARMRAADPAGYEALVDVLCDAARATAGGPRPFTAILAGD